MNKLTMSECSKKKLDEINLIVYAIKNEVNIKKGECKERLDANLSSGRCRKLFFFSCNNYKNLLQYKWLLKSK